MNETPIASRESVPTGQMKSTESSLQELRVKVAELCGWKDLGTFEADTLTHRIPLGVHPNHSHGGSKYRLPNYSNDLNACHEFEKMMYDDHYSGDQWTDYVNRLVEMGDDDRPVHATAEQRSRAFVAVMEASRPEAAESFQKPTEALTASGVPASPLHPLRLSDPIEGTLRKEWEDYLACRPDFDILCGPEVAFNDLPIGEADENKLTGGYQPYPHGRMTTRDHMVAAELIQWLGSPVGFAFLTAALERAGVQVKFKKFDSPSPLVSVEEQEEGIKDA